MLDHAREGMAGPMLRDEFIALAAQGQRWDPPAGAFGMRVPACAPGISFRRRVDGVLRRATQHRLAVILDMHHYAQMMLEPQSERERFLAVWRRCEHYRDAPAAVLFGVAQQAEPRTRPRALERALAALLPVVRRSSPHHALIVGGGDWNSAMALENLRVPAGERNLIATFPTTADGGDAPGRRVGAGRWRLGGTRWRGTPAERQRLRDDFDRVSRWAATRAAPVLLGEFGAYSRADDATRIAWTRGARGSRARGFAWALWELASASA